MKGLFALRSRLKVIWFDDWHPILDDALKNLPEIETCPHELFRLLAQNNGFASKRIALVTEHKIPVAVLALHKQGRMHYEVATWMIPAALFPAKAGYLLDALEALGVEVWFSWRRMDGPPPVTSLQRYQKVTPVYSLDCSGDFEKYWRETGLFKGVRYARNRCKDFEVRVNSPGSAEWTIRSAAEKWSARPTETSRVIEEWAISDWILAANYWESRGKHITIQLLDSDTPVGGTTFMMHGDDAVGGMVYRKPGYESFGIGNRLLDLSVSYVAQHGLKALDFGGGADYKRRWAPENGKLWLFSLCPKPLFLTKQVVGWVCNIQHRLHLGG